MQKRKTLIILTDYFPFGAYEVFLLHEIKYLQAEFDHIFILACHAKQDQVLYELPEKVKAFRFSCPIYFTDKLWSLRLFFSRNFQSECIDILNSGFQNFSFQKLRTAIAYLHAASILSGRLKEFIYKNNLRSEDLIIYSIWADWRALAATQVNEKAIAVSRAHNADVYFERHPGQYLPFRKLIFEKLDAAFFISEDGRTYTQNKIPAIQKNKFHLSRLGIESVGKNPDGKAEELFVVSCSRLDAVKRIDLIGKILSESKLPVQWIHFGDGKLSEELKNESIAWQLHSPKLKIDWRGNISNAAMMEFYMQQHVDLFINMSEYEGIPVAIMEAMSAGIPVLATDVGGVREIVNNKNGKLIAMPIDIKETIQWLLQYFNSTDAEIKLLREHAFETWRSDFNAAKNSAAFTKELASLCK